MDKQRLRNIMKSVLYVVYIIFIVGVGLFPLVGFPDHDNATRVLQMQGYKDIRITGLAPFSCRYSDKFRTGFVAKTPTGGTVTGAQCSGLLFKNSTIRFK